MISAYSNIDLLVIILYLLATLGIGLYYSHLADKNTEEYFLAGKSIGWFAVGLTIFSTNISSEHFIGLAGSGSSRGLAVGQFELMAIFILVLLGWIPAPIYFKAGVMTMPEFLEERFDKRLWTKIHGDSHRMGEGKTQYGGRVQTRACYRTERTTTGLERRGAWP